MKRQKHIDCRRFEILDERLAEGGVLTAEERAFRDNHMAVCADCRAVGRMEDLLAYREAGDGPLEPLDEVSLRRHVTDILAVLEDAGPLPATDEDVTSHRRGKRWLALGAMATALAATLAVVALWPGSHQAKRSETLAQGEVLYRAGQVASSSAGNVVGAGTKITVRDGRAGVGLPCKAGLVAFAQTEVRVGRLTEKACDLRLVKGRIFVTLQHVDPPIAFVIHTKGGAVSVRGTAFSVSSEGRRLEVSVLRGLVSVDERSGGLHMVAAGQGYGSGQGSHALASGKLKELTEMDSGLRLAMGGRQPGVLTLHSKPGGAAAFVDGVAFGSCPLEARIQSGMHVLRLSWPDGSSARVTVDVPAGGRVSKTVRPQVEPSRPGPPASSRVDEPRKPDNQKTSRRRHGSARGTKLSPDQLMAEARKFRAQGRWREAAARYEQIADAYRGQAVAATAQVLLGWVLLRHLGRPADALRRFEAYLARGGALSQDAYGKILSLRRLGRTHRERAAIKAFLTGYPRAIQVSALKRRLESLDRSGPQGGRP